MVSYMHIPRNKLTLGSTELTNVLVSAKVTRVENGFDSATIVLPDTSYYPGTVTQGTTVELEVKDDAITSYTTIFVGVVRFVVADTAEKRTLTLSCLGAGYGLGEMVCADEYGSQSKHSTHDTITKIVSWATGIIDQYVNKILESATASNYNYDYTTSIDNIADTIPYIVFPYKPVDKCLNDLCDLITAYKAGSAGPHWIVTTDSVLHLKLIDQSHTGWTKYYGNSAANATLTYGVDYEFINLEKTAAEANYIIYYGNWRKPSNGDAWTDGGASGWGADTGFNTTMSDTATNKVVDTDCVKALHTNPDVDLACVYPASMDAAWDFSIFTDFNTPNLNFYIASNNVAASPPVTVALKTDNANYYTYDLSPILLAANTPYHVSLPIGPYYNKQQTNTTYWTPQGNPDWSNINYIQFYWVGPADFNHALYIDGLHFGGANICRVARLSDYTGIKVKQRVIVDDVGKDDSLIDADDSGLMAKLAYSELLRLNSASVLGQVQTPMIADFLPGQWIYVQGTDYRVTKLIHTIGSDGYKTALHFTSDTTNSRPRARYEDLNKQFASIRPEWQDRQASTMKAGSVDWRITRLYCDY